MLHVILYYILELDVQLQHAAADTARAFARRLSKAPKGNGIGATGSKTPPVY